MERFIAEIKGVPRAKGFDEIFYPGEMEARNDQRNRAQGLQLAEDTIADLRRIAAQTGLQSALPIG